MDIKGQYMPLMMLWTIWDIIFIWKYYVSYMVTWYNITSLFLITRSILTMKREDICLQRDMEFVVYMTKWELLAKVTVTLIILLIGQLQNS